MANLKNNKNMNIFNISLNVNQNRILLVIIIFLIIILLFRKKLNTNLEKIVVFFILFLILFVLTKNLLISIVGSLILFCLINLNMRYTKMVESFENLKEEPTVDFNVFNTKEVKDSSKGIQDLLKKVNGGIELKESDKSETKDLLNEDPKKYSDDKKPHALRDAQKEAFELIDTVNALKDTLTTLAPVLTEGKKLMGMFENFKL